MADWKDLLYAVEPWEQSVSKDEWNVIAPTCNYWGLSYGQWASKWLNWVISPNPDQHNNGPVVFLRGMDFEQRYGSYSNFVRIRDHKLRISLGQALFWPIICLFVDEHMVPSLDNEQKRLSDIFDGSLNADRPPKPEQATIDGQNIVSSLKDFFAISPDFILHVPATSSDYNSTLGQYFKIPLTYEGDYKAVIGGYFMLIKPKAAGKTYTIASNGNAEDGYHTETFVEIEVVDNSPQNRSEPQANMMKKIVLEELAGQEDKESLGQKAENNQIFRTFSDIIDKSHEKP